MPINQRIETASKENTKTDFLKVIAIITMLIDHIGYLFFPQHIIFRIIGRLAFPIFAYQLAMGYTYTKDMKKYAIRLLLFGVVSQAPYILAFNGGLNILFTLLLSLGILYALDKKKYSILVLLSILPLLLPFEYGYYGVFSIISFYIFRNKRENNILFQVLINTIYFLYYFGSIQILSLFALALIYKDWKLKIRINKYVFYVFYPLHITILYIISKLI